MNDLVELFPFIKKTMLELEQQNKFMNKVTLTGKINAMHVAANLFAFTDKTALVFDELKTELITALLDENLKKITNELSFKAKTIIDILIRNLFERTADVGFLSTDTKIINYLISNSINDADMFSHLQEYASKYSVYNEILIFDTNGMLKINLNKNNHLICTQDPIIQEALSCDGYVERYAYTDMFKTQEKTLLYAQKIIYKHKNIGVICLCFKFKDELNSIFKNLSHNKDVLCLSNTKEVLASHIKEIHVPYRDKKYSMVNNNAIAVTKKTVGYQGYTGINDWFATAIVYVKDIDFIELSQTEETQESYSALLSDELHAIINKANNIIEDIADVIINGELIASKQKIYLLTPILNNLRTISTSLFSSISNSIKNLEMTVKNGLVHDAKVTASLALDIMDRNLYERANDSRWWALTQLFKEELSKTKPNEELLGEQLKYINDLYTVYTNIILFDNHKTIISTSNNKEIIGTKIDGDFVEKTLQNTNTQYYFVSDFEKTKFYNDEATYIYSASVVNNNKIIGGIAVIFDAKVEFEAILKDSFPSNHNGFLCFIDNTKMVISSSCNEIKLLSTLEIDDKFIQLKEKETYSEFINFYGEKYIVASAISSGYREYKREDNYKNDIYCLVFLNI